MRDDELPIRIAYLDRCWRNWQQASNWSSCPQNDDFVARAGLELIDQAKEICLGFFDVDPRSLAHSHPRARLARKPRGRILCATRNGLGNRLVIAPTLPSSFGTCITSSIRRSRNDQVSALSADLSLSQ